MISLTQHRWVQHFDLNCRGVLYGGRILDWVDSDCTMVCQLNSKERSIFTTGGYERVSFFRPGYSGDRLRFVYEIIHVGNSSVTVLSKVHRMTGDAEFVEMIFSTLATLVCIDGSKRPCSAEDCLSIDLKALRETKRWKSAAKLVAALKEQRKSFPCLD